MSADTWEGSNTPSPPAAGPVTFPRTLFDSLIQEGRNMERRAKLGMRPETDPDTYYKQVCETLEQNYSPDPTGLVWVTLTEEHVKILHEKRDWDYKIIRTKDRKFIINQHDVIEFEDECFRMVDGSAIFFHECEWLDESTPAQQVFSRDKVEGIFKGLFYWLQQQNVQDLRAALGWFNNNYPIK